jgi:hypothetical protein
VKLRQVLIDCLQHTLRLEAFLLLAVEQPELQDI